jgi:hypothetical protein
VCVSRVLPGDDVGEAVPRVFPDPQIERASPQPIPLVDGGDRDALALGEFFGAEVPLCLIDVWQQISNEYP